MDHGCYLTKAGIGSSLPLICHDKSLRNAGIMRDSLHSSSLSAKAATEDHDDDCNGDDVELLRASRRRTKFEVKRKGLLCFAIALILLLALVLFARPARGKHEDTSGAVDLIVPPQQSTGEPPTNSSDYHSTSAADLVLSPQFAYATLLSIDESRPLDLDAEDDPMFVACRILAYQLLYAPETRSERIPFIVLAVPGTSEAKKERLRLDGAIVLDIESLAVPAWIMDTGAVESRYAQMFDKLRLWELEEYDRVLFLDADTVLVRPLDQLFTSSPTQLSSTDHSKPDVSVALPEEYVFVAGLELNHDHHFPPTEDDFYRRGYFNAGFFLLQPSRHMLAYYLSVLEQPYSFSEVAWMEQSLLNHVHARDGPMPFAILDPIWNVHFGSREDIDGGVHSLHTKWWKSVHADIRDFCMSWRWRMAGFFENRHVISDM